MASQPPRRPTNDSFRPALRFPTDPHRPSSLPAKIQHIVRPPQDAFLPTQPSSSSSSAAAANLLQSRRKPWELDLTRLEEMCRLGEAQRKVILVLGGELFVFRGCCGCRCGPRHRSRPRRATARCTFTSLTLSSIRCATSNTTTCHLVKPPPKFPCHHCNGASTSPSTSARGWKRQHPSSRHAIAPLLSQHDANAPLLL